MLSKLGRFMYNRNKGSVLAISLVILTAITLISVFALERSGLQSKIVRNIQYSEMLFHSAMNEQEFWTKQLRQAESGDDLLSEPLSNFVLDVNNVAIYSPVIVAVGVEESANINLVNNLVYIPNTVGDFALAEGEEVNERINYQLQLSSTASINIRNTPSVQTTGISFTGLNTSKNAIN